jgi:hypothetical protein
MRIGLPSAWKTTVDDSGRVMPVERFEPSTPRGDLFLRQARIPFRHTGSLVVGAFYLIRKGKSIALPGYQIINLWRLAAEGRPG